MTLSLDGGGLLHDVVVGVGEPLVEADESILVDVHGVELTLAGGQPVGVGLVHGGGGGGQAEAAGGGRGNLDHGVKLLGVDGAVPKSWEQVLFALKSSRKITCCRYVVFSVPNEKLHLM